MAAAEGTIDIRHCGHACVLVHTRGARVLIDPGSFSDLPDDLGPVDAVAITHAHHDHLSLDLLQRVLDENPTATVRAPATADLTGISPSRIRIVASGDEFAVGEARIAVVGGTHALIHADVPQIENVGFFFIDDAILHPGDEFVVPDQPVSVLLIPISGPWQSLGDIVDYVRTVSPSTAVPIHEGMLARPQVYIDYLARLAPEATSVVVLPQAEHASA